ncbi:MAG: outer membrane beta-barrel family protein [Bacteroidales bacterium]
MNKYLTAALGLLCIVMMARAEYEAPPAYGTISGVVIDEKTKEPIPYVNVVVRNRSDSILTGGITDEKGQFLINDIPEGNSRVEIQFIGYEKIVKEIRVSREQAKHDFSTIVLSEDSQQLDEVVIQGEVSTVTQKIDRKVINVGKDLTASGTNASELLNNVQSVSVDGQTGEVSLRGNENVRIFVDGKPTNIDAAQLLRQIPSSSIKSIELITNPSAKYSPEGMSGIINIVLHKNTNRGFNGTADGGITAGKNIRYNGATNLNYHKNKVNVYLNYGGNRFNSEGGGEIFRFDTDEHSLFTNENHNTSHLLKTGIDLYMNEANTISFYTSQNLFDGNRTAGTMIYYNEILDSDHQNESLRDNYSGTYNLNFKHDFGKEGHSLEMEASYTNTGQQEDGTFEELLDMNDLTSNYTDDIFNAQNSNLVNLDYTNPLTENSKLEMGLEYRFDGTLNSFNTTRHQFVYDGSNSKIPDGDGGFMTIPIPNSSFEYDRTIYSAYTNYNRKFGQLAMQLGVRVEQYDVDASFNQGDGSEAYTDSKLTAYPSAFLTYTPGEKNQFQVSYSRRVDRPGISQVNPIRSPWSSPLTVFVGNPELLPQFTNSYELNYTRRLGNKGSVSLGTFYRSISDNIIRYTNIDPLDESRVLITYENAEGEERYGFELSGMYRPTGWWNLNASADLYSMQMTGYAFGEFVEVKSVATNIRVNSTFRATENLSFQLFGLYRGANEVIQYTFKPMWFINSGVSLKVLQKRGTLSFRVNDIFKSMRFRLESTNFYPTEGAFFWESRTANLSFSYNFGKGESKMRKRKQRDSHELSGGEGF